MREKVGDEFQLALIVNFVRLLKLKWYLYTKIGKHENELGPFSFSMKSSFCWSITGSEICCNMCKCDRFAIFSDRVRLGY